MRRAAIFWWRGLEYMEQVRLSLQTSDLRPHSNIPVTGREIEDIYKQVKLKA
jgi:hypothetical protein